MVVDEVLSNFSVFTLREALTFCPYVKILQCNVIVGKCDHPEITKVPSHYESDNSVVSC